MSSKNKKTRKKKPLSASEEFLLDSDDTFAFIAGYTTGGVAYGITWEEMREIEQREETVCGKEHRLQNEEETDLPFD